MKFYKSFVVSLVLFAFISIPFSVLAFPQIDDSNIKHISTDMNSLDIIATAAVYLSPEINGIARPTVIVPLYDYNENIVAHYISFSSGHYAVVNNNTSNPTVLEFGEGTNFLISEILERNPDSKIIYNDPFDIIELSTNINSRSFDRTSRPSLTERYPDLLRPNRHAVMLHEASINAISIQSPNLDFSQGFSSSGDWGFIDFNNMPSGSFNDRNVSISGGWTISSDFRNPPAVKDICGPVAITNLALLFSRRGNTNLMINNSNHQTFTAIHALTGNGPVPAIAGHARTYFSNRGFTLRNSAANTVAAYRTAAANNRPVGLLLMNGHLMHWVLGIGYRHYTATNTTFFQVVDGWNRLRRFYRPHQGSSWVSGTQYWIA